MQVGAGSTPSWWRCATEAYFSAAWHCEQTLGAGRAELCAVRLVAVAAGHAGREHPALLERAVIVDLVAHLPVGLIEAARQRRDRHGCRTAGARVSSPRRIHRGAHDSGRRSRPPCAVDRRREIALRHCRSSDRSTRRRRAVRRTAREAPCADLRVLPNGDHPWRAWAHVDVARALAVAGLAADADLGKVRREAILGGVVVLAHAGRMAFGAHEVPVLIELGPMQDVVVFDVLFRVEVKPALAALVLGPRIPGERERLHAAVGKFDEVLLQRIEAEGVFHFERGELAVRPVGLDEELAVLAKEARRHAVIVEARVIEVAEHGCRRSRAPWRGCAGTRARASPRCDGSRRRSRCRRSSAPPRLRCGRRKGRAGRRSRDKSATTPAIRTTATAAAMIGAVRRRGRAACAECGGGAGSRFTGAGAGFGR